MTQANFHTYSNVDNNIVLLQVYDILYILYTRIFTIFSLPIRNKRMKPLKYLGYSKSYNGLEILCAKHSIYMHIFSDPKRRKALCKYLARLKNGSKTQSRLIAWKHCARPINSQYK